MTGDGEWNSKIVAIKVFIRDEETKWKKERLPLKTEGEKKLEALL